MSTSQRMQTGRAKRRAIVAVLAAGLLGGCLPPKEEADGGEKRDAQTHDGGGGGGRDSGAGGDGGREDGGVRDAAADAGAGSDDAGGDAVVDSAVEDSGPVIIDPTVPGDDPPTLAKVGYYDDDLGPRVLLGGRDPNGDIASYTIKFFNGAEPVSYDIDNDIETPSVNEFTDAIAATPGEAGFFVSFEPTRDLVDAVDTIKVVVHDEGGRASEEVTAQRKMAPRVSGGCDPLGFNRCSGTNVCARSGPNFVCTSVTTARNRACSAALVLEPPSVSSVRGQIQDPSLWDAPASCSSGDPTLKADRVVKLRLSASATKVVLSTDNEYTTFDTMLYLLSSCTSQPAPCVDADCPCADDLPASGGAGASNRAVLELRNLSAGDYWIVVDSFPSPSNTGSAFELSATIEE